MRKHIEDELTNLTKILEDNKWEEAGNKYSCGARIFKVDGNECVFIIQVESHVSRGQSFSNFSPLEFECAVEFKKEKENIEEAKENQKRTTWVRI